MTRRRNSGTVAALEKLFEIIHEDAELLVINKPADLVCHPSKNGELSSLIGRVRLHLGGDAHPHLVNRLDRETSGVTLVAKTDAAARELRQLWEKREVQKEYLAIVHGHVREDSGLIDAPLGKDDSSRVAYHTERPKNPLLLQRLALQIGANGSQRAPLGRDSHPPAIQHDFDLAFG